MSTQSGTAPASVPHSFKAPSKRERFTRAYWDGLRQGKLMLQTCRSCGKISHPPSPVCTHCLSTDIDHRPASGRAKVYAFTISHRPLHAEFQPDLPYVVALVDLEEGVRIMTWLVDCPHDQLKIGMDVEACYEKITDEVTLHRFRPAGAR